MRPSGSGSAAGQTWRFEVFTAVTMKNAVFWDMSTLCVSCGTNVSEEHIASIFKVNRLWGPMVCSKDVPHEGQEREPLAAVSSPSCLCASSPLTRGTYSLFTLKMKDDMLPCSAGLSPNCTTAVPRGENRPLSTRGSQGRTRELLNHCPVTPPFFIFCSFQPFVSVFALLLSPSIIASFLLHLYEVTKRQKFHL
jgi:hypothetical protein